MNNLISGLLTKGTLEEKYRLLEGMLEAVYIDLGVTRSVVGIQPKTPFYPLFESLGRKSGNRVTVFNPNDNAAENVMTGSSFEPDPENFGLVETGES